jgi:hypothetical protein
MQLTNLWSWLAGGPSRPAGRRPGARNRKRFAPALQRLEDRTVPAGYIATGAGPGAPPFVSIRVDIQNSLGTSSNPTNPNGLSTPASGGPAIPGSDGQTDFTSQIFLAYAANFLGGVHVAAGNFDGDYTTPDSLVTAPGAGGGPHVIVWRMKQLADGTITTDGILDQFMAYDPRFAGGVNVTTGDLDGDGQAELITAPSGGGGPHVKVWKLGADGHFHVVFQFMAYDPSFTGGVSLSSGQGYQTASQVRQVINAQLPNAQNAPPASNFAVVPYPQNDATTPGNFTNAGINNGLYVPLVGTDWPTLSDQGVTGNSLPTGEGSNTIDTSRPNVIPPRSHVFRSPNFFTSLPYVTIASGGVEYLGGNLLNSYGNLNYSPNVFDPNNSNPPFTQPLVFASWAATDANRPAFALPDVVYGPFVETTPAQGNSPPIITRLQAPSQNASFRNQLITGAGPGGGPHVKVFDIVNDASGWHINSQIGFMAFDVNFRGGVNVSIGDVTQLPTILTIDPTTGQPAIVPDNTGKPFQLLTFPYNHNVYAQFTPEITVSMASGGNQARIFADFNPTGTKRASLADLDLLPVMVNTTVVPNLGVGGALGGFTTTQDVSFFDQAIDPQFRGDVYSTTAGLRFAGTASRDVLGRDVALAESVFAAGPNPGNPPSRGALVKLYDKLGAGFPSNFTIGGGLSNFLTTPPTDQFQAFPSVAFPGGAGGVAFGFGSLPRPSIDAIDLTPITVQTISGAILR